MNILITGISGFVGEYLSNHVYETYPEAKIFGLERTIRPFRLFPELNNLVKIYECDITNFQDVQDAIGKIQPDQIYHLAGFASASGKDRDLIFNINVGGTINILKSLKRVNKKARIILASSAYVYGQTDKPAKEDFKIHPSGFYAESKAEMEKEAQKLLDDNLEIIITRAANHTGPGQRLGFVVPDFASQIVNFRDKKEIIVGNLESKRDFLSVRDVVRAYQIIMDKGVPGEVYNISSGKAISIKELLEKMIKISGKDIAIRVDPDKFRPSDFKLNVLDNLKIKSLGWQPEEKFDETLKNVLAYWQKEKGKS